MYAGDYPARRYNAGLAAYQAYDYVRALAHFQKSADMGDGDALNYLGSLYEQGLGTAKDPIKAVRRSMSRKPTMYSAKRSIRINRTGIWVS